MLLLRYWSVGVVARIMPAVPVAVPVAGSAAR